MQTTRFSLHTLVFLLVFLCAAVMASTFVFRASHKPVVTKLSADVGLLFPAPRDIKPFDLVSSDAQAFTLKDFYQHWTLLFFGFTHCSNVCPTTLDMISKAYEPLHAAYPNLQVVLISLDPERDNVGALKKYVRTFNANFIGATGKLVELRKLQSQLGIVAERDQTTGTNYQLQHTSSILLINPQGKWAGIYKFGLRPGQFVEAVKRSISF